MKSEFYQDYKDLSIAELVRVAKSPWDYQPEAVRAAERILRERGVSTEEIAAEEWALAQNEMLEAATRKQFSDYFDWVGDLFQIDLSKGPAEKWFGLFLLFYGLYYVYYLYRYMILVVSYYRCTDCRGISSFVLDMGVLHLYYTVTLFWVMKQKPLGWALLCIQAIVLICAKLATCYHFYERHVDVPQLENYILALFVNSAILVFLFRPFILELFRVDRKIMDRALLVAAVLGMGAVFLLV